MAHWKYEDHFLTAQMLYFLRIEEPVNFYGVLQTQETHYIQIDL